MLGNMQAHERESGRNYIGLLSDQIEEQRALESLQKSGSFEPDAFEDRYESALIDLINQKRNGIRTTAKAAPKSSGNVINLMDALKRSLASEQQSAPAAKAKGKKPPKRIEGQREMLLPISGKRGAKEEAKVQAPKKAEKPVRAPARSKKAG